MKGNFTKRLYGNLKATLLIWRHFGTSSPLQVFQVHGWKPRRGRLLGLWAACATFKITNESRWIWIKLKICIIPPNFISLHTCLSLGTATLHPVSRIVNLFLAAALSSGELISQTQKCALQSWLHLCRTAFVCFEACSLALAHSSLVYLCTGPNAEPSQT